MAIRRSVGSIPPTALRASAYGVSTSASASANATAITSLLSDAATARANVLFDQPGTFAVGSGLTWNSHRHSIECAGDVFLDFSSMTSGTALTVIGQAGTTGVTNGLNGTAHQLAGLTLLGPDTDAGTVDGVLLSDTSGAAMVAFRGMRVRGFRDNLKFGDNVWLTKFHDCAFSNAHRYGIDLTPGTNAGENISFYGCVINNTHNASDTGIGLRTSGNPDGYLYGCSLDYNDIEIHHTGGKLALAGGHIENGKAASGGYVGNPMIKLTRVSGQNRTMLAMSGVEISPTEGVTTAGTARDHLIENTSDSGDHVYLTCTGCVFDTYDGNHTIFKNQAAGAAPRVRIVGGMWDNTSSDGTRAATIGTYTSLVTNGDMESSSSFEASAAAPWYPGLQWRKDGGGATFAMDTTSQRSGTRCISCVGAPGNAASTSVKTAIAVTPGMLLQWSAWIKISAYTSGTLSWRVMWYLDDYTTRTVVASQKNHTAVQDWTPASGGLIVPAGITMALIDMQSASFVGTAYLDDVTAHQN